MREFYERYSIGISSNNVVNYISNGKIFKQQTIKKGHLTQLRVMVFANICGDNA